MWHLQKIPKIAHFYWGNETLSYLRYMSILSFKTLNPDWEIRLYYPKVKYGGERTWHTPEHTQSFHGRNYLGQLLRLNVRKIQIEFADFNVSNAIPETFKSDFLRWRLLATVGGLWSDTDIMYLRPMGDMEHNNPSQNDCDTVICLEENGYYNYHTIGFLMAAPRNEFYRFVETEARKVFNLAIYQSTGANILNRCFPTVAHVQQQFERLHVVNLPLGVVYPLNDTQVPLLFETGDMQLLNTQSIGVHWFGGHQATHAFENSMDDQTLGDYDNILAQLIRRFI